MKTQAYRLKESTHILELIQHVEKEFYQANPSEVQVHRFQKWKEWASNYSKDLNPIQNITKNLLLQTSAN